MFSERLEVANQVLCRISPQVRWMVQKRLAPAASALIEQDYPVCVGVEIAASAGAESGTRPAMNIHSRRAIWITATLPIDSVVITNVEPSSIVGFYIRVH